MKRIFCFVLAAFLAVSLIVCDYATVNRKTDENATSMFVIVEETTTWRVVYHKETRVMYAVSYASYNNGNFELLVNPDGTPMLYQES